MSNHTKYKKIVLSVAIILAISTMFVACARTDASPNKITSTNETCSQIVANTNMPEVMPPSTDMAVNRQFIEELRKTIGGSNLIENLLDKFDWNVDKKNNKYDYEMIFDEAHSYIVSLNIMGNKKDRAIDYKKDEVIVKNIVTGEEIMNPSVSEFLIIMQQAQKDIESDNYKFDENTLEVFMDYLTGSIPLGDIVEKFSFNYNDGAYKNTFYSTTHEYDITVTLNDTNIDDFIDYSKMAITLECVSEG